MQESPKSTIIYLEIGGLNTMDEPLVIPVVHYGADHYNYFIPIATLNLYTGTKSNTIFRNALLKYAESGFIEVVDEFDDMLTVAQRDYIFSRSYKSKRKFLPIDSMLRMIGSDHFERFRKLFILTDQQWETLRSKIEKLLYPIEEIEVIEVVLDDEDDDKESSSPPRKRKFDEFNIAPRDEVHDIRKQFWAVQDATRIAQKGLEECVREIKRSKNVTQIMLLEQAIRQDQCSDLIFKQHTLAEKFYRVLNANAVKK